MSADTAQPEADTGPPGLAVYLRALRRTVLVVLAAVVVAGWGAFLLSERVLPRVYESSALVIVVPNQTTSDRVRAHPGLNGFVPDQSISETFRQLGQATPVAAAAADDLEVPLRQLRGQVSTHIVQKTPLLRLTARADDPAEATRVAQGYAAAFVRTAGALEWVPGAEVELASPAAAGVLVSPRTLLNTAVAAVVALLLAGSAVLAAARFGSLGRAARPRAARRPPAACPRATHSKAGERAA